MTQVDSNALKDKSDIQRYFLGSVPSGGGSDPPDNSGQSWAALAAECEQWAQKTPIKSHCFTALTPFTGTNMSMKL
jgi:beta-glucosidase